MHEEGLFRVRTAVLMRESHRLNSRTVAAGPRALSEVLKCVCARVSVCVRARAQANEWFPLNVLALGAILIQYLHTSEQYNALERRSSRLVHAEEEAVGRSLTTCSPPTHTNQSPAVTSLVWFCATNQSAESLLLAVRIFPPVCNEPLRAVKGNVWELHH